MLFAKPYLLWKESQQRSSGYHINNLVISVVSFQELAEPLLLGLAAAAVPVMLFLKPYGLWRAHRRDLKAAEQARGQIRSSSPVRFDCYLRRFQNFIENVRPN